MVLRDSPVTFDTASRPPQPAARTSLAANNRRPRSSRFEPSASHRSRIASLSIIHTLIAAHPAAGNPPNPSQSAAPHAITRFSYLCACPKTRNLRRGCAGATEEEARDVVAQADDCRPALARLVSTAGTIL